MDNNDCCGEIIGGDTAKLIIRQKSGEGIEVGDLLVEEKHEGKFFLQVFELRYGSQISDSALENISGMRLEGIGVGLDFMEPHLRNYVIASAKVVLDVRTDKPHNPKILPSFMGAVRHIKNEDLNFLTRPENPLYFGRVRSGSKVIDADVFLRGTDVIPHHILIPATTGRGKSNLIKVMKAIAQAESVKFRQKDTEWFVLDIHHLVQKILLNASIEKDNIALKSHSGLTKNERLTNFVKEKIRQEGYENLYKYICSGEDNGYHKRPTCKSRKIWFDLGELPRPDFIFPDVYWKKTSVPYNEDKIAIDKQLYMLTPRKGL